MWGNIGSGKIVGSVAALSLLVTVLGTIGHANASPNGGVVAAAVHAAEQDTRHHRPYAHVSVIPNRGPDHVQPVVVLPSRRRQYSYTQRRPYSAYPQQWYTSYFRPDNWRNWRWRQPSRQYATTTRRRYYTRPRPVYRPHGK